MTEQFRDQLQEALAPAYTIEREITGGGMSRVFVALEHALGRTVVVKVLRPDLAAGMNRDRFRREIMLAAQLHHPHIVPVLSAGERGELIWYTMPFVEGESLREALLARGKFSPRDVVRVLHHVLDALAYAHQRGVIHRDIKPGNILTHGTHALVTDFGVAKALTAALPHSGATSAGLAIGTPAYMAPEQLAADPKADHRMDLYAVGLLAYELLTGEQPFSEASPAATMAAQLTRMPQPIERSRPDVPAPLAGLVTRLLAKQPDDRPRTARAALEELEELMTPQSGILAPAAAGPALSPNANVALTPAAPHVRRGLQWAFAATALGAVVVSALVLSRRDAGDGRASDVASQAAAVRAESVRVAAESAAVTTVPPPMPNDTPRTTRTPPTRAAATVRDSAAANPRPSPRSTSPVTPPVVAPRPAAPRATTAAAPLTSATGRLRRVAVLPVTDATQRPQLAQVARAIEDSLKRALAAAGYTLASDSELVRLLADRDGNARRNTAEASGIGAVVSSVLTVSNRELQAQVFVLDVWRNTPQSQRAGSELDDSTGTLNVVRDVVRSLNRVSWRHRTDPRRIIVFDFDNLAGSDSLTPIAKTYADSVRAVARRFGAELVGDSTARATRDENDRRFTALVLGTGAYVVASISRRRADSLRVRVGIRDMSEDRADMTEFVVPLREPLAALPNVMQKLAADLGRVNWGPKGTQSPPGGAPPPAGQSGAGAR